MNRRSLDILIGVLALAMLSACGGGSKILKEPVALELKRPLAVASDDKLAVTLDWVIVKDGPGTWSKNAWWDEYVLRVANSSGDSATITAIEVVDMLDTRLSTGLDRKQLVAASKQTARRFAEYDVEVRPGAGTGALVAMGTGTFMVAGVAAAATVASGVASAISLGSATASTPAVLAVAGPAALLATPVLIVGGIVKGANNARVNDEISNRQVVLPLYLASNEAIEVRAFFPVAPSPQSVRLIYETVDGPGVIEVDTREPLDGLHINGADRKD